MTRPTGCPLLTGSSVTVTSSPALNVRLLQPRSTMSAALLVSTTQFTVLPLSSLTSNFSQQCGLAQSHSVTVPFSSSILPPSKAAWPWWANTGVDTTTPASSTHRKVFIRFSSEDSRTVLLLDDTARRITEIPAVRLHVGRRADHFDDVVIGRLQFHRE